MSAEDLEKYEAEMELQLYRGDCTVWVRLLATWSRPSAVSISRMTLS